MEEIYALMVSDFTKAKELLAQLDKGGFGGYLCFGMLMHWYYNGSRRVDRTEWRIQSEGYRRV